MKTRLKNVIHNNYIHETQQAAMRNYVLTQKKIGDTISAHVRLKEILNNIMNIIIIALNTDHEQILTNRKI